MSYEVELAIVGEVTDSIKKALLENLNALRSMGVRRVSLRIFTRSAPLKYLEGLREVLLANMVTSIRLYEHDLSGLRSVLERLVREGKEVIVVSGEEPLKSRILDLLSSLKSEK
jgi:hypothetical protein